MADGDLTLIPEVEPEFPLGRAMIWHDPGNRNFPAAALPQLEPTPRKYPWYTRDVYNQIGSSCTAQAAVGVCRTSPFRYRFPYVNFDSEQERFDLYRRAQSVDPWPGEEPTYEGSSTDAPFKILRTEGHIREWRWLFGLAEFRDHLKFKGPVAVGTYWYRSMFHPDDTGTIEIAGDVSGGHAWRVVWYDEERRRYRAVNSWGRQWGQDGRFWVPEAAMERLLAERGEAATVVI